MKNTVQEKTVAEANVIASVIIKNPKLSLKCFEYLA